MLPALSPTRKRENFFFFREYRSPPTRMNSQLPPMNVSVNTATAKSLQSCPTLCDPIDGSPPGSPVPGILQARTLEWVAISFSNARKWKVKVKSLSRVWLFASPWTAAHQAPQSMGFSRQEYWSGVPSPSVNTVPPNSPFYHIEASFLFLFSDLPMAHCSSLILNCNSSGYSWVNSLFLVK